MGRIGNLLKDTVGKVWSNAKDVIGKLKSGKDFIGKIPLVGDYIQSRFPQVAAAGMAIDKASVLVDKYDPAVNGIANTLGLLPFYDKIAMSKIAIPSQTRPNTLPNNLNKYYN